LKCHQECSFQEYVKELIMHEIRIAKELSDIVLEVAGREKLEKVTRVNISFGQLIQIVPDIFDFAFREAVRGTLAMDAPVDIEILPLKMKCKICNDEFNLNDNMFSCKRCGSTELDIIQGKELFIKSIEGE
jgi:hydrogenase nickel incorporation protein HypA/HybF